MCELWFRLLKTWSLWTDLLGRSNMKITVIISRSNKTLDEDRVSVGSGEGGRVDWYCSGGSMQTGWFCWCETERRIVKDDSLLTWGEGGVEELSNWWRNWNGRKKFRFLAVMFEKIEWEPWFNLQKKVRKGSGRKGAMLFGGNIELGVITVEVDFIFAEACTVYNEQKGPQYWALEHTSSDRKLTWSVKFELKKLSVNIPNSKTWNTYPTKKKKSKIW